MKIAVDISQIVYEGTGVANYTINVITNLAKREDIELLLFGYSYGRYEALVEFCDEIKRINQQVEIKLFKIPERVINILWNTLHWVAVEHLIGPVDIVHTSDWIEPPSYAKKVTTIHDLVIYKYANTSHPYIIKTQAKKLALVQKEGDKIFADSEATKEDIANLLKIPSQTIEVAYPGIDERIQPKGNHMVLGVKKRYKIEGDYILCVGTQEPRKNIKTAIDAFTLFREHPLIKIRKPGIELIIVGKYGWGESSYTPPGVRSLGFVEKVDDLSALYSGALMLVYPSLYEGFGFPVLEAMKCGCPTIISNKGSLAEIGKDSAVLVDPYDIREIGRSMVTLTINNKVRAEYTTKGKTNAQKFTWDKTITKIVSVYKSLLDKAV